MSNLPDNIFILLMVLSLTMVVVGFNYLINGKKIREKYKNEKPLTVKVAVRVIFYLIVLIIALGGANYLHVIYTKFGILISILILALATGVYEYILYKIEKLAETQKNK